MRRRTNIVWPSHDIARLRMIPKDNVWLVRSRQAMVVSNTIRLRTQSSDGRTMVGRWSISSYDKIAYIIHFLSTMVGHRRCAPSYPVLMVYGTVALHRTYWTTKKIVPESRDQSLKYQYTVCLLSFTDRLYCCNRDGRQRTGSIFKQARRQSYRRTVLSSPYKIGKSSSINQIHIKWTYSQDSIDEYTVEHDSNAILDTDVLDSPDHWYDPGSWL